MTPIVLHHGMWGFDVLQMGLLRMHYWNGIDHAIAQRGYPVITTQVHPSAGVERRAKQLKSQILGRLERIGKKDEQVVIIAHSMGGVDARYMISRLDMAGRVAALVTVGAGHRGSSYYEWLVRNFDSLGQLRIFNEMVMDIEAMWDATPQGCRILNEKLPDMPGVRYFSIAGVCPKEHVPPVLWLSYRIIEEAEGENDGHVSLASAQWGQFLGAWPAHHFELINWPLNYLPGDSPEDISPRYLELLDYLSGQGVLDRAQEKVYAPR